MGISRAGHNDGKAMFKALYRRDDSNRTMSNRNLLDIICSILTS